jgi:tetratricopeptide (TPR) repeat protein
MKPVQIGLLVFAVAGASVLFMLPKSVVNNNKEVVSTDSVKTKPSESHEGHDHASEVDHAHEAKLTQADLKLLEDLKKQLANVDNSEKKLNFADSISGYYRKLQQYDSAAYYSEVACKVSPSEASWAKAGDRYEEAFNFSEEEKKAAYLSKTKEYYEKVLAQNPKNLEVKSKLAMTFVGGEQTMKGVKLLREVLADDPNNETAIFNLGILSIQSGQYEKALDRFDALVKINPNHATAHFYRGVSYLSLGNKEKAKACFLKAKSLEKDKEFNAIVDDYIQQAKN